MYIVFEGIDNSGKTTQIKRVSKSLKKKLNNKGYNPVIKCITEKEIKKYDNYHNVNNILKDNILRFALQRLQLQEKIKKIPSSDIIISDRSYFSSYAYQGLTSESLNYAYIVNSIFKQPDMLFYFDKGCNSTDTFVNMAYDNYPNILPLNTIPVLTRDYSISKTTKFLTSKISHEWLKYFGD